MKNKFGYALLAGLYVLLLSQPPTASAWQDNQDPRQATKVEAAKARGVDTTVPPMAPADKTKASRPGDTKLQEPKNDQRIRLSTDIVNVTISVTDPYGRFVTGLSKDRFEVYAGLYIALRLAETVIPSAGSFNSSLLQQQVIRSAEKLVKKICYCFEVFFTFVLQEPDHAL